MTNKKTAMNEIHWLCSYCEQINMWSNDDEFQRGETIICEHCKLESIINDIKYILHVVRKKDYQEQETKE